MTKENVGLGSEVDVGKDTGVGLVSSQLVPEDTLGRATQVVRNVRAGESRIKFGDGDNWCVLKFRKLFRTKISDPAAEPFKNSPCGIFILGWLPCDCQNDDSR